MSKKISKKKIEHEGEGFLSSMSNRMEILFGELKDRIQMVAEGVTMNSEKIDRLRVDVETLQTDMTEVKGRLVLVEHDVSEIKEGVSDIRQNFATKSQVSSGLLGLERRLGKKIETLDQTVFS